MKNTKSKSSLLSPSPATAPTVRTITKVLIANRGEIALRVIKTCRRVGIASVAVYAPADSNAPYVREADTAVQLDFPIDFKDGARLLKIAIEHNADAIHPGYGFLSENPEFSALVEQKGLLFIGPSADSMRALGNKSKVKEIAATAQVPVPPTLPLDSSSTDTHQSIAEFGERVGFPIMIKASSGGGGRGMRVVTSVADIENALEVVTRESTRVFGSSDLFIEKFISPARHVEVQILGDKSGNVVAIGTRDCTVQRSNQKIIEEGPAPELPQLLLQSMCEAAVKLARAAHYHCAGTVEFLVTERTDASGVQLQEFFLLEVNCRLQVEHPVTECNSGRDLVLDQIRLTEGYALETLGISAESGQTSYLPTHVGHAIEARICAEAFDDIVTLSCGSITDIRLPETNDAATIRNDFGYSAGCIVSTDFDSMLGKIIAHAPTREAAINGLRQAVEELTVTGVRTNKDAVLSVLSHPDFVTCTHTVAASSTLLPTKENHTYSIAEASAILAIIRVASWGFVPHGVGTRDIDSLCGWSLGNTLSYPWSIRCNGVVVEITTAIRDESACITSRIAETSFTFTVTEYRTLQFGSAHTVEGILYVNDQKKWVALRLPFPTVNPSSYWLHLPNGTFECASMPLKISRSGQGTEHSEIAHGNVTSPLPGKVSSVEVKVGAVVTTGAVLVTLDSMKMEHPVRAPCDGCVVAILAQSGSVVAAGDVLVTLEPASLAN